jgi:hypothetical protein
VAEASRFGGAGDSAAEMRSKFPARPETSPGPPPCKRPMGVTSEMVVTIAGVWALCRKLL